NMIGNQICYKYFALGVTFCFCAELTAEAVLGEHKLPYHVDSNQNINFTMLTSSAGTTAGSNAWLGG
ncbi:MAG: hypothetical protein V1843_00030, partial [bacterium]